MRTSSETATDFVSGRNGAAGGAGSLAYPSAARSVTTLALVGALLTLVAMLVAPALVRADLAVVGEHRFNSDFNGNEAPGEFGILGSVGVSFNGAGGATPGDLFLLDTGGFFSGGGRIQQYSQAGQFRRLWGTNATASGPGDTDEIQMLRVQATGGTYTLSFGGATTAPIAFDASPATIDAALEALSTIGGVGSSVSVTGGPGDLSGSTPYRIVFGGAAGKANQPLIRPDSDPLTGGEAVALVAEINPGKVGFELCEPTRNDACGLAASGFATPNFTGGSLSNQPASVVVDPTSGAVYAASYGRINRYTPTGEFERAFGFDAVFSGPGDSTVSERQQLVVQATGGTYRLTFMPPCCGSSTTQPIPFDWPASDPGTPGSTDSVEEALNELNSIGGNGGWVTVAGGPGDAGATSPYVIDFRGNLAGDDVSAIQPDGTELSGSPRKAEITTSIPGGAPEVCLRARNDACGTLLPTENQGGGALQTQEAALAIVPPGAADAGNIVISERFRNRVDEFTESGEFVRSFGWDVNKDGGTEFELCLAGEECKAGVPGSGLGQFETPYDVAVDSIGAIYVLEQGGTNNRRVQKFVPSGPSLIPSQFGGVNEQQTVTVKATAGSFRLGVTEFGGTTGSGSVTNNSPVVSNVVTTKGEFRVGQPLYGGMFDPGTTIVSVSPGQIVASSGSRTLCNGSFCTLVSNATFHTPDLPASATAGEVEAALNALPTIADKGGSVTVTGGPADATGSNPFEITFNGGGIAGSDPAQLVSSQGATPLSGGTGTGANEAVVETTVPAGATGRSEANTPFAIGVGPGDDVYIGKRYQAGAATCANGTISPSESRILILPSDGSTVKGGTPHCGDIPPASEFGEGARQRIVVNPGTGTGFLSQNGFVKGIPNRVFVLDEAGDDPDLTLDPTHDITASAATVSGTITPNGPGAVPYPNPGTTKYRVEHRKTSETDWELFSDAVPIGSGFTPAPFSISVGGLEPSTEYEIRVVAAKPHGFAEVTAVTPPFTTLAAPPLIETFSSANVTIDSADLKAIVNPRGTPTSYHFEYGTTPSYGQSTPEVDIGDSKTGVPVQDHIDGLEPTVYHFRVVATNSEGTVVSTNQTFNFYPEDCPNSTVRQQTGSGALPDCRAYEIVSPGDTGTALLGIGGPVASRATSPARFGFLGEISPIPGPWNPPAGLGGVQYVATRTVQGWETQYVGFPADVLGGNFWAGPNGDSRGFEGDLSLDRILIWPTGHMYSAGPHMFDSEGNDDGRLPTNVADVPGGNVPPSEGGSYGDWELAPNGSHYFFSSGNTAFAPGGLTTGTGSVYDNEIATEEVSIASKLPGGGDIPPVPGPLNENHYLQVPMSSDDGSHLLILAPAACATNSTQFNCPRGNGVLYMRVDGTLTYEVSQGHAVDLEGITRDGRRVYFTSVEDLTGDDDDTSRDLYEWNESTDAITHVSDAGPAAGNTDACNASWIAGCGVEVVPQTGGGIEPNSGFNESPPTDNSIAGAAGDVYFYSPEQLVSGEGFPGRRNLYVARNGGIQYVATLDAERPIVRVQVSPDGDFAAFVTASRLTSYDNTTEDGKDCRRVGNLPGSAPGIHCLMMYVYEADTDLLRCASCKLSGERPQSNVTASMAGLFMTDDGRTFFSTLDPLVPPDTNEDIDVYEFVNNRPHLITSGAEIGDEYRVTGLIGVSANGVDAYFSTLETLVADDENGRYLKFYTARTNGGFPVSAQIAPCQAADECHAGGSDAGTPPGVTSIAGLGGTGNYKGDAKKKQKSCPKGKKSKKGAKRCKKAKRKRKNRRAGR